MKAIDFLQITAALKYPPAVKSKLSSVHATLIDQFVDTFTGKHTEKSQVIHALNCITYMYTCSDSFPESWNDKDPIHTYRDIDDDTLQEHLGGLYVYTKNIDWSNVIPKDSEDTASASNSMHVPIQQTILPIQITSSYSSTSNSGFTDKRDLYIQPPEVPRFDTSRYYASGVLDDCSYVIYPSYPIVPTKQNEISATTDVSKMSENDLMRLFPNCLIKTRATCMYEPCDKIELDPVLGLILPIKGFTKKQLRDNVIQYPHIFKLLKEVNGQLESFYTTIEVDGELHKVSEYWNQLPESKIIPYTKEFVKEYVVRRYLLERDIRKIDHKYPMYGSLDPFLTLFTTAEEYASLGCKDPLQLARDCVSARVNYKKSRNPVLRRLANV